MICNDIGVSYSSDVDRVLEVLNEVAYRNPYRMQGREPIVRFKEFGGRCGGRRSRCPFPSGISTYVPNGRPRAPNLPVKAMKAMTWLKVMTEMKAVNSKRNKCR